MFINFLFITNFFYTLSFTWIAFLKTVQEYA